VRDINKIDKLKDKISKLSTKMLKDSLILLGQMHTEETLIIFPLLLNELEKRMEEKEYIKFCDSLE